VDSSIEIRYVLQNDSGGRDRQAASSQSEPIQVRHMNDEQIFPHWVTGPDANNINEADVDWYQTNGFIRIRNVLSPQEVNDYHQAAADLIAKTASYRKDAVLDQRVNVWQQQSPLRELTLHPRVAAAAQRLAGTGMRLWHDQLLVKQVGDSAATEFHQDQPYWPHENSFSSLTAWIALVDVPVDRGCMSFIPGSHRLTNVPRHELEHERGLFDLCPDLQWLPRISMPLRAGDCTFHHGRTAHYAGPNRTDVARIAHAIIYVDKTTTFSGARHVITNPLELKAGQELSGDLFPLVGDICGKA
jgi:ectoine hydroxylase-related dioxygenase (phytanoyl-CoA dioxygenase family)